MAGLREAQKQATRAKVLAAARELFVEVGYEAATIRTIAERAGVAADVGSLEAGKRADVLVLSRRLNIRRVFIAGIEPPSSL